MNNEKQTSDKPNYFMRRAAAGAVLLGVGAVGGHFGGEVVDNIVEVNEMHPLTQTSISLEPGQSVISAVENEVESFFTKNNIDPSAIPYGLITEQGQQASSDNLKITHETADQPGDSFDILIQSNELGAYDVKVKPSFTVSTDGEVIQSPEFFAPTPENPAEGYVAPPGFRK